MKVFARRTIDAPSHVVWGVLDDFASIQNYHPLVVRSRSTNEKPNGAGAERFCRFEDGNVIHERIVEYRGGEDYRVHIYDVGKLPLRHAYARVGVTSTAPGASEAFFEFEFTPKFGPLGLIMGELMMKPQFRKLADRILEGLDVHVKTGDVVGALE